MDGCMDDGHMYKRMNTETGFNRWTRSRPKYASYCK